MTGSATTADRPPPRELPALNLDISPEVLAAARAQNASPAGETLSASRGNQAPMGGAGFANALAVDVSEIILDPDLDEAVIAFANADFEQCESSLVSLLQPGGSLLVTDLCSHNQNWAKEACGDLWLGFEQDDLARWATAAGLVPGDSLYVGLRNGFQIQVRHFQRPAGDTHHR